MIPEEKPLKKRGIEMIKGESNIIYTDSLPDGVIIGLTDTTIIVGSKKEFTEIDEVLMEVAKQKLCELEEHNDLYISDWCKTENENVGVLFNEIRNMMPTDDLKKKILQFDTAAGDHSAAFGESQFIQGYLEGYKLAKQMLENKKERTAVTVRSS
jgi:hypothetical protein